MSTPTGTPDNPQATKVEAEIQKVEAEVVKIEDKLADPKTTDEQAKKLEGRLDSLDTRMDSLIEKFDKLAASPVAPAPARKVEDITKIDEPAKEVDGTVVPPEEVKPKKAYVSRRWFGDRAYES